MSVGYQAISWNRQKRIYDFTLAGGIAAYLAVFLGVTLARHPNATIETALLRALGTAALLLLHVVLAIGPLCRLDRRFLPLLYNRRHLGVTTFLLGLAHGVLALIQFHAQGNVNALVSLLSSNTRFGSLADFPFQLLGFLALVLLFLMAATSHDFWLRTLSPPVWKALHMGVYAAYGLLVLHVVLGVLQSETRPWLALFLGAGVASILGLHLAAARREWTGDRPRWGALDGTLSDPFVDVCAVAEIPEKRARVVTVAGERVAIFRYDGKVSAISNVCRHQNGPLGEGKIVDGCVTCPWHGYQYRPESGAAPAPFSERVATFRVRVVAARVLVHPTPLPPGTPVEPALVSLPQPLSEPEFYVGYLPQSPPALARWTRRSVVSLALLALALGGLCAFLQQEMPAAMFEYSEVRTFRGRVQLEPAPLLWMEPLADASANRGYLLVAPGKHGAWTLAEAWAGRAVELSGKRIWREGTTMVEIVPGTIRASESVAALPESAALGKVELAGEIVDGKCYLGVMIPGAGKTHRDCAVRCIAGGAPPMLVVERGAGVPPALVLLAGPRGEPIGERLLDFVAEPVTISGELVRLDDHYVLYAEPKNLRRVRG
jgi:methionine sulfoxide reductase heme-binding subunit